MEAKMNNIEAALQAFAPEIAYRYEAVVRSLHEKMVAKLGDTLFGIYNDVDYARAFRIVVAPALGRDKAINNEKLRRIAAAYAAETVADWSAKTSEKLGAVEEASVAKMSLDGCSFLISGTKSGRRVALEQQIIIKVSSKGVPFNQFPARIYLDGKFISESAFKKAF
jgi:hypothetical protein